MKKLMCVAVAMALLLSFSAVNIFAANPSESELTLLHDWKDNTLNDLPGNGVNGKDQNTDNVNGIRVMTAGKEGAGTDHTIWGAEVRDLEGNGTVYVSEYVVKVEESDLEGVSDETVIFSIDPSLRPTDNWAEVNGPVDITVADWKAADKDSEGYAKFYMIFNEDFYDREVERTGFAIENRLSFKNTVTMTIKYLAFYTYTGSETQDTINVGTGTTVPSDPDDGNSDNNEDPDKDPDKDTPTQTGDVSAVLAVLTAGAAVFGGLKLRRK